MKTMEESIDQIKQEYKQYKGQFPFITSEIPINFIFFKLAQLQNGIENLIEELNRQHKHEKE